LHEQQEPHKRKDRVGRKEKAATEAVITKAERKADMKKNP